MPPSECPPTRAEFERLKAEHERLTRDMEAMRETARQMRQELQTQFQRIAQIQAVLDEERRADIPPDIKPLIRHLPK